MIGTMAVAACRTDSTGACVLAEGTGTSGLVTTRHCHGAPWSGKHAPLARGRAIRLFGLGALWTVPGAALAHDLFSIVVLTTTQLLLIGLVVLIPVVLVRAMFSPADRQVAPARAREVNRLVPGFSLKAEVLRIMGSPSHEWQDPDGHITWEYTQSRDCPVTYMLRFKPDGILLNVREIRTPGHFGELRLGMTPEVVRRLLGSPDAQAQGNDGATRWVYTGRYADGVTHLLRFGPDETLAEIRVLVPKDHFAEVATGMDRRAVEDLLGPPDEVIASGSASVQTLCWRYKSEQSERREFQVRFDLHDRAMEMAHLGPSAESDA
jgi:outer membrane protein assembly factor BamE (lipoprotein component of BamABCDE complex)